MKDHAVSTVSEIRMSEGRTRGLSNSNSKKAKKPSRSLFSMKNQSLSSQVSDTVFVLRQIISSAKNSQSPSKFTKQYILQPIFKNDLFVVSFGLPALSATPRVLDAAPSVHSDASSWTYHGERTALARKGMLNVASYNYLGFVDLEYHTRKLLEHAVKELPFANDEHGCNERLEEAMKGELRKFMGFEGCVLTPSGYAINLVAFPAMATSTQSKLDDPSNGYTIFLMDSESHSSMFMGAFIASASGQGKVIRFRHNDVQDLISKLGAIYESESVKASDFAKKNVWICIEGMYSMDGTLPPLKDIVLLKRKYGFRIYIDEAHSFMAIGSNGRGVVEYFINNVVESLTMQDIDMMGGTISKSMSSVGGFVLSSEDLKSSIEARASEMRASRGSSIPTLSLIRSLQILRKPKLVVQRLAHLRQISNYIIDILEAKGYKISATRGSPLIAIIVDSVDRVLSFLKVGREVGLICCGAAYPAAPRGAPRVRLSLTGAHTWDDVYELLRLIDQIALVVGIKGLRIARAHPALQSEKLIESNSSTPIHNTDPTSHSDEIDASILAICPPAVGYQGPEVTTIRAAGLSALSKYNLGASGPRWMYGTFAKHLELEELLNSSIKSLIQTSISPEIVTEQIRTTLFTDTRVGIMSVIATAMEGLTRQRAKIGERHIILLPKSSGLEIREGAAAAQPDQSKRIRWYEASGEKWDSREDSLSRILTDEFTRPEKTHLTMHLDADLLAKSHVSTEIKIDSPEILIERLSPLAMFKDQPPLSITLILNDSQIFASRFESTRALISALKIIFPSLFNINSTMRILLFGSFETLPHLPGLQGAFCTGSKHLVEKVQFLGQGVMYTAMPPPLTAALAEESFKTLLKS